MTANAYPRKMIYLALPLLLTAFAPDIRARDIKMPGDYPNLAEAIEAANPACDRVVVSGNTVIKEQLAIERPLTLISSPPGARFEVSQTGNGLVISKDALNVVVDGFSFTCAHNGIAVLADAKQGANIKLSNLSFLQNGRSGISVQQNVNLSLSKCKFSLNGLDGCTIQKLPLKERNPGALTLSQCEFTSNTHSGISAYNLGHYELNISESRFAGNKDHGILLYALDTAGTIKASHFDANLINGLSISNCARLTLSGCSFLANGGHGIFLAKSADPLLAGSKAAVITMDHSILSKNQSGINSDQNIELWLSNCKFSFNEQNGCAIQTQRSRDRGPGSLSARQCEFTSNTHAGINAYTLDRYELNLDQSMFSGNGEYGFTLFAPETRGTVRSSRFDANLKHGLFINNGAKLQLSECSFRANGDRGIFVVKNVDPMLGENNRVELQMEKCDLSNNNTGIFQYGDLRFLLQCKGCSVNKNRKNGLTFDGPHRAADEVRLESTELNNNDGNGISVACPLKLKLSDCHMKDNLKSGVLFASPLVLNLETNGDPSAPKTWSGAALSNICLARFKNVAFESNAGGLTSSTCNNVARLPVMDEKLLSQLEDGGLPWPPPNTATFNLGRTNPVPEISFTELEKDFGKDDSPELLAAIGQLHARHRRKKPADMAPDTLSYLKSFPDRKLACRLFQNSIGGLLSFSRGQDRQIFLEVLNNHPNSPLADAIATELALESLYWPAKKAILDQIIGSCTAPADTLAGCLLHALNGLAQPERIQSFLQAYAATGAKYPESREKSRLNFASSENPKDRFLDFYQKCMGLAYLLNLSQGWLEVDQSGRAEKLYDLAKKYRAGLWPAAASGYFLPAEIQDAFEKTALKLTKIHETRAPVDPSVAVSAAGLVTSYKNFLTLLTYRNFLASQDGELVKSNQDELLQCYLDSLVSQIKARGDAKSLATLMGALVSVIFPSFSPEEQAAAGGWLDQQAGPLMTQAGDTDFEYHQQMAAIYRGLKDTAKEAEHLIRLTQIQPKSAAGREAWDRLSDLYLSYWQLPDKALEMQREIIRNFAGTEEEYKSKLRIAKIFYEQKDYPQAIYNLTKLLESLPAGYAKEPAQTMLGLAYIGTAAYDDARNEFAQVINKDQGEYREKCLYLMGYSYICEQKYADAVRPFTDLIALYPSGMFAKQAQGYLEKIKAAKE